MDALLLRTFGGLPFAGVLTNIGVRPSLRTFCGVAVSGSEMGVPAFTEDFLGSTLWEGGGSSQIDVRSSLRNFCGVPFSGSQMDVQALIEDFLGSTLCGGLNKLVYGPH